MKLTELWVEVRLKIEGRVNSRQVVFLERHHYFEGLKSSMAPQQPSSTWCVPPTSTCQVKKSGKEQDAFLMEADLTTASIQSHNLPALVNNAIRHSFTDVSKLS